LGDTFSGALSRVAGEDVGNYAITLGTLTAGSNYDLSLNATTVYFVISKRPITVKADPKFKTVGAVDPALTYSLVTGSLVAGDAFAGSLTRDPGETVGPYTIRQGTLTLSSNYTLTFNTGVLNIYFAYSGFLQPINDTAHQTGLAESKFKLGQTIPAKFVLKNAAGAIIQQVGSPTFSRSGNLGSCDATTEPETITEVITPDAGVVYVWDGNQYHYNWSTKGLPGAGEYRIYANLADGTKNYVDICLN
jgi:hypothetical protein